MDLFFKVHVCVWNMFVEMAIWSFHVHSVWSYSRSLVPGIAVFDIILAQILIFGIIIWALDLFSWSEATKPLFAWADSFSGIVESEAFDWTLDQDGACDLFPA